MMWQEEKGFLTIHFILSVVPYNINSSCSDFGVSASDRHGGSKGSINAEDNALSLGGHNSQIQCRTCVVTPGDRVASSKQDSLKHAKSHNKNLWVNQENYVNKSI